MPRTQELAARSVLLPLQESQQPREHVGRTLSGSALIHVIPSWIGAATVWPTSCTHQKALLRSRVAQQENPMRPGFLRLLADKTDRVCGLVTTSIAIFLYLSARDLPFGTVSAPDSGFFPKILSVLLAVLGLAMLLRPTAGEHQHDGFTRRSWAVPLGAVALLAYAALLTRVGFVLTTILILFFLMTAFGRLRWTVALAASASAVIICYLGFTELGVPLPQGILTIF
jgi:putative tricarboxylic transport membrane protein